MPRSIVQEPRLIFILSIVFGSAIFVAKVDKNLEDQISIMQTHHFWHRMNSSIIFHYFIIVYFVQSSAVNLWDVPT